MLLVVSHIKYTFSKIYVGHCEQNEVCILSLNLCVPYGLSLRYQINTRQTHLASKRKSHDFSDDDGKKHIIYDI